MGDDGIRAEQLQIRLGIDGEIDGQELEEATSQLHRQLLELDVEDVARVATGPPPDGARAGEALELGVLVVALLRTPSLITALASVLSCWISAKHGRSAVVELNGQRLELSGVSGEDRTEMIRLFEATATGVAPTSDDA
jgi:Effector Associated Constant Component 1